MNRRLSEARVRATCRELLAKTGRVSGRALSAELRRRFGAVGKTERISAIWRDEVAAALVPGGGVELKRRLAAAEARAADNLKRAELAEYREQAHQDKWAMEVDRLRSEVSALKSAMRGERWMEDLVQQLRWQLAAAQARVAELEQQLAVKIE